jgi:hypothetical protein
MRQKKRQESVIDSSSDNEDRKRELALKVTALYESVAPGTIQRAQEILRKLGFSEEVAGKFTDVKQFTERALADPNLNVTDVEKLTACLSTVEGKAPSIVKTAMREMVKGLPRMPGGGRPSVPDQKKKKVVKELLVLLSKGGTRPSAALRKVAKNNSISYRTMQRIWAEHQKKSPQDSR